jgi:pimeloyl-ACP methyl ester carboxylesterase
MSAITIDDDLVHYEVLGHGRPVILLHGWLGSWRYWVPAMQQISMKYRVYALDLWGFGDSGRDPKRYDFLSQVKLLEQFMEKLGIGKAALIGHSLGASIIVRYALQYPDRVPRLMAVSTPMFRMAPPSAPLTFNSPPAALPASVTTPPTPAAISAPKPPANDTPPINPAAEAEAEADTVPWRTEEMKARIRAALEKQAMQADAARPAAPKSPRDAAMPPADQPVKEIVVAPSAPPPATPPALPETLAEVPVMPKVSLSVGDVQRPNPLKDHLQVTERIELLKRHVDPGPDLDKLKVEVDKADNGALTGSLNSFADVDTLREMQALRTTFVVTHGAKDTFSPPPDAQMISSLAEGRPQTTFRHIELEDVRHFPMLEDKAGFTRLILAFLETPDVSQINVKEIWVRRVR